MGCQSDNRTRNIQRCTVCSMTVNLHKGPPPTERRGKLCQWRKHIFRAEGGISCAMLRKCSSLGQIRREQKMPGPLLLVYFMTSSNDDFVQIEVSNFSMSILECKRRLICIDENFFSQKSNKRCTYSLRPKRPFLRPPPPPPWEKLFSAAPTPPTPQQRTQWLRRSWRPNIRWFNSKGPKMSLQNMSTN